MIRKPLFGLRAPVKPIVIALGSTGWLFSGSAVAATAPPPPPSSPPLYAPGVDALARAAAQSSSAQAQAALAERCKALLAAGRAVSQMPPECRPYLPVAPSSTLSVPPALFVYAPAVNALRPPSAAPAPVPPSAAPTLPTDPASLKKYCEALLARGIPYGQLPPECRRVLPDPASSSPPPATGAVPLCPDPTVFTHVRMIPCPPTPAPAPSGQRSTPPPPAAPPTTRPPAPSPTPPAPTPNTRPPAPPAPGPATIEPPTPAPVPAPPAPPPPQPVPPVTAQPVMPPPVVRGAASQIPMGGGNAGVSPLSLPPPRVPSPPAVPAPVPTADANDYEAGEVVVFAPFAQAANGALEVIANAGGTVLLQENLTALEGLLLRVRANDGDAVRLAQVLRAQLPQAAVDLHGRLFLFPLSGAAGPGGAPRHYARAMLQFPATPPPLTREMRVGIIDSGVERVGALRNGVAGERSFLPNEQSPADSVHGTAVASLIAGQDERAGFSGAVPGAKLFVARAMSNLPDGRSYTNAVSVLQALNWLASERVPIVNMSLGGKGDATLALGIAQAIRKGMTVVAAAGNGGPNAAASFPAALPDVIAVTAVDVESKLYKDANRGDYVMVAAPGVDVWAPKRDGTGSYVSGTSFASAWVSGAVAYAIAATGTADATSGSRIGNALCRSSRDLGKGGRDAEFGCGLLQVSALLDAVKSSK